MANYWDIDVYRYYTDPSYARPRKIVDKLKLDWLDAGSISERSELIPQLSWRLLVWDSKYRWMK